VQALIRTLARHRIVGIDDADDLREERNVAPAQPVGEPEPSSRSVAIAATEPMRASAGGRDSIRSV